MTHQGAWEKRDRQQMTTGKGSMGAEEASLLLRPPQPPPPAAALQVYQKKRGRQQPLPL